MKQLELEEVWRNQFNEFSCWTLSFLPPWWYQHLYNANCWVCLSHIHIKEVKVSTCGVKKQVMHALYLILSSHSTQQSYTKNLKQTLSLRCNSCIFAAFSGSGLACWMRISFNLSHALEIMRSMLVNTACEQNTAKSFPCNYVQLLPWPT